MGSRKKIIGGVLILFFLVLAVPLTVKLVRERQELRRKAAVPEGTAELSLTSATNSLVVGQRLPVTVKIKTPTTPQDRGITGVKVTLKFSFSGTSPLTLTSQDIEGNLPSPWNYAHKEVVTSQGTTIITIEAVYLEAQEKGYLGAVVSPQTFATLNFSGQAPGTVTLEFDPQKSEIRSKEDFLDILGLSLASQTYTVTAETTLTPTPTSAPSPIPSPSPTSPPATPTPTTPPSVGGPILTVTPASPTATLTPTVTASPAAGLPTTASFAPTFWLLAAGSLFLGLALLLAF